MHYKLPIIPFSALLVIKLRPHPLINNVIKCPTRANKNNLILNSIGPKRLLL